MSLYNIVQNGIVGRIGMTPDECDLLASTVSNSRRHCEIGCLWGGSAILAALAGARVVYTIDKMTGGWWDDHKDPECAAELNTITVLRNFDRMGIRDRIRLVVAYADPFPLDGYTFDTLLIDGDHSHGGCMTDFINVNHMVNDYLMFHDCDEKHQGVLKLVNSGVVEKAGWELFAQVDSLRVYGKSVLNNRDTTLSFTPEFVEAEPIDAQAAVLSGLPAVDYSG